MFGAIQSLAIISNLGSVGRTDGLRAVMVARPSHEQPQPFSSSARPTEGLIDISQDGGKARLAPAKLVAWCIAHERMNLDWRDRNGTWGLIALGAVQQTGPHRQELEFSLSSLIAVCFL